MLFFFSLASNVKDKKKEVNYKSVIEQPRLSTLQVKCVITMLSLPANIFYTLIEDLSIKWMCSLTCQSL